MGKTRSLQYPKRRDDKTESGIYRGNLLVSHAGTFYSKVFVRRFFNYCEAKGLFVTGGAIRVSTGSLDHGHDVCGAKAGVSLFMPCYDLQKAYDTVDPILL